jgi:membrane protease YdiL (CAAX protease family)
MMIKKSRKTTSRGKLLTIAIITFACLAVYGFFPARDNFQQVVSSLTFLLVIPLVCVKIVLKETFGGYGLQIGEWKKGIVFLIFSLSASLCVFYIFFNYTLIFENFRPPELVTGSFASFVLYEILLVGTFAAFYEFFFRGFLMFGFSEKLGKWSIALQAIVFIFYFLVIFQADWSLVLFAIAAPFSGLVAHQSRSLIYSFICSWLFIVLADSLTIILLK